MEFNEILIIAEGKHLNPSIPCNQTISSGCAADLMSDVLTLDTPNAVLITGLCNPQVIRTALMAEISVIVFVRGKKPSKETLDLANSENIPLITSKFGMFELCGRLHQACLPGTYEA
ncbi:MAG: hypothetical protein JEZ06_11490 [Anaerolineaceae bacterium]|nr:hypothetical protein [Anaerolineaceae bacterium]